MIKLINNSGNIIISLPTGCGKNMIIIFSIDVKKRYLILVPRIILMEQIKSEIIKHRPELKSKIQTIGDNNSKYDDVLNNLKRTIGKRLGIDEIVDEYKKRNMG